LQRKRKALIVTFLHLLFPSFIPSRCAASGRKSPLHIYSPGELPFHKKISFESTPPGLYIFVAVFWRNGIKEVDGSMGVLGRHATRCWSSDCCFVDGLAITKCLGEHGF
jgi:hypothetical protein